MTLSNGAFWRSLDSCKAQRFLRTPEHVLLLPWGKNLWEDVPPGWKKRKRNKTEETYLRLSLPSFCTTLDGSIPGSEMEGEDSPENVSGASVRFERIYSDGRGYSLIACSRRIPDMPDDSSSLDCTLFPRPRLRISRRRRPKWLF